MPEETYPEPGPEHVHECPIGHARQPCDYPPCTEPLDALCAWCRETEGRDEDAL